MGLLVIPRGGVEAPPPIERHAVEANTVALYQLNGDLLDSGSNAFHLTEVGTVPYVPVGVAGKVVEQAAKTTAANHGTQTDLALNILGALTITNMVRMDPATNGLQTMASWGQGGTDSDPANNYAYRWVLNSGRTLGFLSESGGGVNAGVNGVTVLDREKWYHVAITRNGGTGEVKLFIDGAVDNSATLTLPTGGTAGVFLAGQGLNANEDMDGDLGSMHILDRELSEAEVLAESNRLLPDWQEMLQ